VPYQPELAEPLGRYAGSIAARRQLGWELADLESLPDCMSRSRERNQIVVLLVDPWVAGHAGYGQSLLEFDLRNEPTSPVLIPFSETDAETVRHRDALKDVIAGVLPNNTVRQDTIFKPDVRSPEQFASDLHQVLEEALNRLLRRGHVYRTPPVAAPPTRPVLDGPDSTPNTWRP
jgi:FxsC-like protein